MKCLSLSLTAFAAFLIVGCSPSTSSTRSSADGDAVGIKTGSEPTGPAAEAMEGFVLIAPLRSTETYLMNMNKEVVHRWKSEFPPAASAYLMENGDLLRCARDPEFSHFSGGGIGGIVERFNWDGELIWSFKYADEDHCFHHDIAPLPNGNVLAIAWERRSKEEAIAQGRDPDLLGEDLWPDHVIEVQPEGLRGGKIVWKWHMWDHLVQDFDREKPNYGIVYEHPELIDLNNTGSTPPATPEELRKLRAVGYTGGGDDDEGDRRRGSDWLHTNAIDYNAEIDQIALSAKNFSEIWIIDHSTTTEEAAGHQGGRSGKGGDLLYRWGNPWSYKSGTVEDKMLFDQHDVRWIPEQFPGAGNITAYNNGPGRDYSSITEIETPIDQDGAYLLDDEGRFGPYELAWEYVADNKEEFFSSFISGAMRLPNGNTMICEGATGRYFEVNSARQTLWEHINTLGGELDMNGRSQSPEKAARDLLKTDGGGGPVNLNALFRAMKYSTDYPGLAGRKLEPLADQPVPFADLVEAETAKLKAEGEEAATPDVEATGEDESPEGSEQAAPGEDS